MFVTWKNDGVFEDTSVKKKNKKQLAWLKPRTEKILEKDQLTSNFWYYFYVGRKWQNRKKCGVGIYQSLFT